MVSYRFCRPDDLPLLVRAINECYDTHFARPPMTAEGFRVGMREIDLWPSNCMVAVGPQGPIGVSVATKRSREVLVWAVGVRPGHQREGHGRHLVTSLRQKLAVLGPERLVAEVHQGDEAAQAFLQAIGFRREQTLVDWERPRGPELPSLDLIQSIGVEDLDRIGLLSAPEDAAWGRQIESLRGQCGVLTGFAMVAGESVEGWLLYRRDGPLAEVVGWGGAARSTSRSRLFDLLCRRVEGETAKALRLPRLQAAESEQLALPALGFRPAASYHRYSGEAIPA